MDHFKKFNFISNNFHNFSKQYIGYKLGLPVDDWMHCTYPHLVDPSTSLIRRGPVRFLARAVGMIGTGLTGVARILVVMVTAPTENKNNIMY